MSYTPNTWVVGDVITADKLNALEQAVAAASAGSGGGYDLVIKGTSNENPHTWAISDFEVVAGSIESCEQKVNNSEPVKGILLLNYDLSDYHWGVYGFLGYFDASYQTICFAFSTGGNDVETGSVLSIFYDAETYDLDGLEWS